LPSAQYRRWPKREKQTRANAEDAKEHAATAEEDVEETPGTNQRFSLRSLAFILCSAMRRERARACSLFPNISNGRKASTTASSDPEKMAIYTPMVHLL